MERKNPGLGGVLRPLGRLGRSKSAFGPQGVVVCIPCVVGAGDHNGPPQ